MPTPEPPPETSTSTPGAALRYSSAQTWATLTIVSEPLFWMTVRDAFDSFVSFVPPPPQAETAKAEARARADSRNGAWGRGRVMGSPAVDSV